MPELSIFEVLGPVMIGPSSSHTAGATRIGWLARAIIGDEPRDITLQFRDSLMNTYSGHATDKGLVAGLLGYREDDHRIKTSLDDARSQGIPVRVERLSGTGHPNEMVCCVVAGDGRRWRISGISLGGGSVLVSQVDGVPVAIDGSVGGYLIRHDGPTLPQEAEAILARNGYWTDLTQTKSAQSSRARARSISFVPGKARVSVPDELLLEESLRSGSEGAFARWVPPLYENRQNPAKRIPLFRTASDAISRCGTTGDLADLVIDYESGLTGLDSQEIRAGMERIAAVMEESIEVGIREPLHLVGGFVPGDDGKRVWKRVSEQRYLGGRVFAAAIARALAVAELNASMGRVVAAPTAGSCGILPGTVFSVAEEADSSRDQVVRSLLVAAGVGAIIGQVASFSGAVAGCQGEVGIASAMSAAAIVHLCGGKPAQVFSAGALALKSMLGLACDPVAGPVEIPCIKRNAAGAANALCAAEMTLAGVASAVPFDDVTIALRNVQDLLPEDLRDNTLGGLGATPTAARIKAAWAERCKRGCSC